ncbi:MAG: acetylglutamate kinase [Bacteroidota bacterium]|nr:acetylglutamate kinase [Bacteroidota bacterium]
MIKVIKVGGNIIDNEEKLHNFLKIYSKIEGQKILIHGGGKIATEMCEKLGIESQMIEGKRVTDYQTLKIVTMVYAGYINKNIVALLQLNGCNAIGLSGADGNLISATKRKDPKIDWGYVGDNLVVDALKINQLFALRLYPVFSAITHDGYGNLLNTNADTIAASIASALAKIDNEVVLVYCFEKKGVLTDINDDNSVIKNINPSLYSELKSKNIVNKGMIPKLDNAFQSINEGVSTVKICMAEDLINFDEAGTNISN